MKLTKRFWAWISQVFTVTVLIWRLDLLREVLGQIPYADSSQINLEIGVVKLGAILWLAWLIWRAIQGFYLKMDFVLETNNDN
jgi:type VI protein secretion system component VasK